MIWDTAFLFQPYEYVEFLMIVMMDSLSYDLRRCSLP